MRILFHYTHKQTMGHTTRSASLAAAICRTNAELLVLQGGVPQPFIQFSENCRVLNIPHPFDTRSSFLTPPIIANTNKRAGFILKTIADFSPDVFITEFFPFGRLAYAPELLPTLRYLRKKGTRIVASIGYPLITDLALFQDKKYAAFHQVLLNFYDTFFIHTPKNIETPYFQSSIQTPSIAETYRSLMKRLDKKITYTGYIFPEATITGGENLPNNKETLPTILVSRGGGAVYPKLIIRAIEAHRLLKEKTRMIIACGPATSAEEMNLFRSFLKPQDSPYIFLAGHLDGLEKELRNCRVSISLSGYNTSVQLMRFGVPSIIIPYQSNVTKTATNDQVARARLLQERFSSSILSYETLTAQTLADAICEQLARPKPRPAPNSWFNGADTTARLIAQDTAN